MPNCGRVEEFTIEDTPDSWVVTVVIHYSSSGAGLEDLILKGFPGTALYSLGTSLLPLGDYQNTRYIIPKRSANREELEQFLTVLHWSLTIADDADESHALQVHDLPPSASGSMDGEWRRTEIGQLVNRAKSYDSASGSEPVAQTLTDRFIYWIAAHPRYRKAGVIVSPPAGNPTKVFDLPDLVAGKIASKLGMIHISSFQTRETLPQKEVGDNLSALVANVYFSMSVQNNLSNDTVLVIDDLYRSGSTACELVRACKQAGASTTLILAATKAARFCDGFSASRWRQAYEDAGNVQWEWAYD